MWEVHLRELEALVERIRDGEPDLETLDEAGGALADLIVQVRLLRERQSKLHDEALAAALRVAELEAEVGRLRGAFRVNMLRLCPGVTHEEIDRVIDGEYLGTGRSEVFLSGSRNAGKIAVHFLHERAKAMNDPHAKAILNVAANELGQHFRRGE